MTHPKKRTKVRKPKDFILSEGNPEIESVTIKLCTKPHERLSSILYHVPRHTKNSVHASRKCDFKKLYTWLGQAIAYLESKKE